MICEKWFKNHQLGQNPKNSPTILGKVINSPALDFLALVRFNIGASRAGKEIAA